jgi:hypothetical protein
MTQPVAAARAHTPICCGFAVALSLLLLGCGAPRPPPATEDVAEMLEFRQEMLVFAAKTGDFLATTRNDKNLTQLAVGWFMYDVLTVLASEDDALYRHFNNQGRDLQTYLETDFRHDPDAETAAIERMTENSHNSRCLAARYALEALRHVPNPSDAPAIQDNDRRHLAAALAQLQEFLVKTAAEIPLPQPTTSASAS